MELILEAANAVSPQPGTMSIAHADLILLNRDDKQYKWATYAMAALGKSIDHER